MYKRQEYGHVERTDKFMYRIGPEAVSYTHLDVYKRQGKRNTHIVATDADNGRRDGASDAVEYSQSWKYLMLGYH